MGLVALAEKGTSSNIKSDRRREFFSRYLDLGVSRSHALWRAYEVDALKPDLLSEPILDLGSGHGELASVLFQKDTTQFTTGIDISHSELKQAQQSGKYKSLTQGDARALPFKDNSFQTVFSFSVLEHIPGVENVFQEGMRVLKPGGKFILTVPLKDMEDALFYPKIFKKLGLKGLNRWYTNTLQSALRHYNMWSKEDWERLAEENGASIKTSKRIVPEKVVYEWDKTMPFAASKRTINSSRVNQRRAKRLVRKFDDSPIPTGKADGTNLLLVLEKPQISK